MSENNIKVEDIEQLVELLNMFNTMPEQKELSMLEQTRLAMGKNTSKQIKKVYNKVIDEVGNKLNYGSSKYLTMGVFNLFPDLMFSFWSSAENFFKSPFIKDFVKEYAGEDKTLRDLLSAKSKSMKYKGVTVTVKEDQVDELFDAVDKIQAYHRNIADYCESNGKTPEEVIDSDVDMAKIIKQTYGSLDNFEKKAIESTKNTEDLLDKLDMVENLPLEMGANMLLNSKYGTTFKQFGIKSEDVGRFIDGYVKDLVLLGKTFLPAFLEESRKKIKTYKALESDKLNS